MKTAKYIPLFLLLLLLSLKTEIHAESRRDNLILVFKADETSINDPECGFDPRICILHSMGNAFGLPFGKVKYETELTSYWNQAVPNDNDGFCSPTVGTIVINNPFGSVNADFQGTNCDITFQSERLPHLYQGQYNITSGTGKYEGAAGTGQLKGWDTKNQIVFTLKGKINY